MRASINELINKLRGTRAQEYVLKAIAQLTEEEMRQLSLAMQANPVCAAQLVSVTNMIFGGEANAKRNSPEAIAHVVSHVGTTLQTGILIGFLLSRDISLIHAPGGVM